jgi:hypothetical protein
MKGTKNPNRPLDWHFASTFGHHPPFAPSNSLAVFFGYSRDPAAVAPGSSQAAMAAKTTRPWPLAAA